MRLRGQRPGAIFQLLWSSLASERAPPPGSHVPAMYGYSRPTEMPDSDWASNSKPFRARRRLLGSLPLKIAGLPSVCRQSGNWQLTIPCNEIPDTLSSLGIHTGHSVNVKSLGFN